MIQILLKELLHTLPEVIVDVGVAFLPIIAVFIIYQLTLLKLPKSKLIAIAAGMVYSYIGLVLFFLGLEIGFTDTGTYLGETMGALSYNWILIPIGVLIGLSVILAEPAVSSLVRQVETLTGGMIHKSAIYISLCIGVAFSVALAMARAILGINLWFIIVPGYLLALILTKYSPPIFTAIAFDSGGVASGPMTSTFVLSFTVGVTNVAGKATGIGDAFGVVAMVAMTPLITIQILGIIFARKARIAEDILQNSDTEENIGISLEEEDYSEEDVYSMLEDLSEEKEEVLDV